MTLLLNTSHLQFLLVVKSGSLHISTTRAPFEAGIAGMVEHNCSFLTNTKKYLALQILLNSFSLPCYDLGKGRVRSAVSGELRWTMSMLCLSKYLAMKKKSIKEG